MTANHLMVLFDAIYLIAMAAWVGSVMFLTFGVAPILFKALDAEPAGKLVRALFPRYYQWGAISGAIALPSAVAVPLSFPEMRGPWVGIQAMATLAGVLIMLYVGNSLSPQINAARDAGPSGEERFERLHRRSVQLNGLVLLIGVGLLIAFAARPRPTTRGIIEPSPVERAEAEAVMLRNGPGSPARGIDAGK